MKIVKKIVGVLLIIMATGSFFSLLMNLNSYNFPDILGHLIAIALISYLSYLFLKTKKNKQEKIIIEESILDRKDEYKNIDNIEKSEVNTDANSDVIIEKEEGCFEDQEDEEIITMVKEPLEFNTEEKKDNSSVNNTDKINDNEEQTQVKTYRDSQANSEKKFVEYLIDFEDINNSYPMIKTPAFQTIIRSHRYGIINRRGYKEESFQEIIENYFNNYFEVSGEVILNTGDLSRPYEPDIALIGKSKYNIRIDVEIDEPYAGFTRQATHCKGEDIHRDNYFKERGWIVIRFSEYQVHMQPFECLNILYRLIREIDNSIEIEELENYRGIKRENSWTQLQAQKWEQENFRERYLGHSFENYNIETNPNIDRSLNSQEKEEERLVKTLFSEEADTGFKISCNVFNSHPRDENIKFYPLEHTYKVNGVTYISASTLVSKFFPEFDPIKAAENLNPNHPLYGLPTDNIIQIWKERGELAANKGTYMHLQIEKYYLGVDYEETEEFAHFRSFLQDHILEPYRTEWRIYDDEFNIAGTIDLITKKNGEFCIYDWKRSEKILDYNNEPKIKDNWGNKGIGVINHIDDTSYNQYCLQQSLYKYILENNYGINIKDMFLVVLHPDYDDYHKLEVPYMENEIISMLNSL
jgi:hypothetical protein